VDINPRTAALKALVEALPGVTSIVGMSRGHTPAPQSIRYAVKAKMFVILSLRGVAWMTLKAHPHMIDILQEQYAGVGHRTHLDHRHWISIDLDADAPPEECERLAISAYHLVRAGLTRKQQAELAALEPPPF